MTLLAADHRLFHLVNAVWTNRLLDIAMPVVTDLHKWPPFWAAAPLGLGWWVFRQRRRALEVLLGLALTVGVADAVSHRLLKPHFHRDRPEKAGVAVILRTRSHAGYSFPSNHAANCFAGAAFLGAAYPPLRLTLLAAAAVVAYSRVYVGVHYPLDVAAGALFGLGVGALGAAAFRRLRPA